jgi:hypothetical protein
MNLKRNPGGHTAWRVNSLVKRSVPTPRPTGQPFSTSRPILPPRIPRHGEPVRRARKRRGFSVKQLVPSRSPVPLFPPTRQGQDEPIRRGGSAVGRFGMLPQSFPGRFSVKQRVPSHPKSIPSRLPGLIATQRIDTDRWDSCRWVHPPYIKCERPVPAGPLLGGPGGTTCPGAPGIFFSLVESGEGDRVPSHSTLDIGLWTVCALGAHETARAEIRSLHSATKTRGVQDQFPRNPGSDGAVDSQERKRSGDPGKGSIFAVH